MGNLVKFGCKNCTSPHVRERNGKLFCVSCGAWFEKNVETNEERDARVLYLTRLDRAEELLRMSPPRFDDAEDHFSDFIKHYPRNSDGYWGLVRARYQIKYEDDGSGKYIPSCYKSTYDDFRNDSDYKRALHYAENECIRKQYVGKAESIAAACAEWRKESAEEKYDIFISYKDKEADGKTPTADRAEMKELYTYLLSLGYRVFFSHMSMMQKTGKFYDPYILNALKSSKVMIVYGSKPEHFVATWVQNEWTRYLKMISNGEKQRGSCIVAYKGFNGNELPRELRNLQAVDSTQKSFYHIVVEKAKSILEADKSFAKPDNQRYATEYEYGNYAPHRPSLADRIKAFINPNKVTARHASGNTSASVYNSNTRTAPNTAQNVTPATTTRTAANARPTTTTAGSPANRATSGASATRTDTATTTIITVANAIPTTTTAGSPANRATSGASATRPVTAATTTRTAANARPTATTAGSPANRTASGASAATRPSAATARTAANTRPTSTTAGVRTTANTIPATTGNSTTSLKSKIDMMRKTGYTLAISDAEVDNGCLTKYNGDSAETDIIIPDDVTSIGDNAFEYSDITSVIIPGTVKKIGKNAFNSCSYLENVIIENGVAIIEEGAFNDCANLESIDIPSSIIAIGKSAFEGCDSLTSIDIPNSVKAIEDSTFKDCSALSDVTIGKGVITIGNSAFYGCSGLTDINIPDNVQIIGKSAFEDCSDLDNATIGKGVTKIGNRAFYRCSYELNIWVYDRNISKDTDWYPEYNCKVDFIKNKR